MLKPLLIIMMTVAAPLRLPAHRAFASQGKLHVPGKIGKLADV
jgi:hypothetical protein